jgi:hypothetical protein
MDKLAMGVHICNSSYSGGRGRRIKSLRLAYKDQEFVARPCFKNKNNKTKRVGGVVQVLKHLPSILEALASIWWWGKRLKI